MGRGKGFIRNREGEKGAQTQGLRMRSRNKAHLLVSTKPACNRDGIHQLQALISDLPSSGWHLLASRGVYKTHTQTSAYLLSAVAASFKT